MKHGGLYIDFLDWIRKVTINPISGDDKWF